MANEAQQVVKVGQVWADNDKRCSGSNERRVRVDALVVQDERGRWCEAVGGAPTHAQCTVLVRSGPRWADPHGAPGSATRIRLDRFRPTANGYRLVSDVA